MSPAAYTIGNSVAYDAHLAKGEPVHKLGRCEGYDGGWVWRTREEAQAFIDAPDSVLYSYPDFQGMKFKVYGLKLTGTWETDVTPEVGSDGIHHLIVDAELFKTAR